MKKNRALKFVAVMLHGYGVRYQVNDRNKYSQRLRQLVGWLNGSKLYSEGLKNKFLSQFEFVNSISIEIVERNRKK